jgi:outer membrane lipoprotein-sorting protein
LGKIPKSGSICSPSFIFLLLSAVFLVGWADSWEEIKDNTPVIENVYTEFVQEKHLEILSRPLISKGYLYFKSPSSLRWEYVDPIQSVLLIQNGKAVRYVESDEGFVRDEGVKSMAMGSVMGEIAAWLNGKFQDNPDFEATLNPGPTIILTPKTEGFAAVIERIEISLSSTPGLIESVAIYENQSSLTRLVFQNAKLNEKIEDALFESVR